MYLDNELSADMKKKVEKHFEECIYCNKEYEHLCKLEHKIVNNSKKTLKQKIEAHEKCIFDSILYKYINNDITTFLKEKVENHLDKCDNCLMRYYYAIRMNNIKGIQIDAVPEFLQKQASQIMNTISQDKYLKPLDLIITISKNGLQIAQYIIQEKKLHYKMLLLKNEPLMAMRGTHQEDTIYNGILVKKEYAHQNIILTIRMYMKNEILVNLHVELFKNNEPYNQARIYLSKNDVVLFSKTTANEGTAILHDISSGQYVLRIPKEDIQFSFCLNEDE
jgi:hypothetical protein